MTFLSPCLGGWFVGTGGILQGRGALGNGADGERNMRVEPGRAGSVGSPVIKEVTLNSGGWCGKICRFFREPGGSWGV